MRDLTAADFEVLEDNTPQKLSSFEMVDINETRLTALPEARAVDGGGVAGSGGGPAFAGVRAVPRPLPHRASLARTGCRAPCRKLLERVIGPDDLVAVMTPDMSASDVTFTRRTGPISNMLAKNWTWGVRATSRASWTTEEQMYLSCFPDAVGPGATAPPVSTDPTQPAGTPAGMFEGGRAPVKTVAREMIDRRREKRTLDALTDLAVFLRGVREERKAVIVVSDGWALYRPDERLTRLRERRARARRGRFPARAPAGPLVTRRGRARVRQQRRQYECDAARQRLSMIDDRQTYIDLMQVRQSRATSASTRWTRAGSPVFDTDLGETFVTPGGGQSILSPAADQRMLSNRIETLDDAGRQHGRDRGGEQQRHRPGPAAGRRRPVDLLPDVVLLDQHGARRQVPARSRCA